MRLDKGKITPIYGFIPGNGNVVEIARIDEPTRTKLAGLADALHGVRAELGLPQLLALLTIANEPGLSVNELAERLALPQQTTSRHVAALSWRYQGIFGFSGRL